MALRNDKSAPIIGAWVEAGHANPDGGDAFEQDLERRLVEIKNRSIQEKKAGSLAYRDTFFWEGIANQQQFDEKCQQTVNDYKSGNFFLERLGRYREVDAPLAILLTNLRRQWIVDYDITTVAEYMIIDLALASYFHFIRLNEAVNNVMASIEFDYFALDVPQFKNKYGDRHGKPDKAVAEDLARQLTEILQPALDQYDRMFIRNLKALRDLKRNILQLKIGNINQMNLGNNEINMSKRIDTNEGARG